MNTSFPHADLLVDELYDAFKNSPSIKDKKHFTTIVHCFFQILYLPVEEEDFTALKTPLEDVLVDSFEGKKAKLKAFTTLVMRVEPWLKKLLWLLDQTTYNAYKAERKMAADYYQYFRLIAPKRQLDSNFQREMRTTTYEWRNKVAHTTTAAATLSSNELTYQITNVWMAYLIPVVEHFNALRHKVAVQEMPDLNPYLQEVCKAFQDWQKRFVALKGKNRGLQYMHRQATEIKEELPKEKTEATKKSIQEWRDEMVVERQKSKGKNAPTKHMMIWGAAGTGKSTTLMVLSFEDAKAKRAHYSDLRYPIPVFLALNTLDKRSDMVENIAQKLKQPVESTKHLLQQGYLRLYLDGFNEITPAARGERQREIKQLLADYPKTFVLLTTRPEDGRSFGANLFRVFDLLPMDREQIRTFLTKNTELESTRQKISQAIRLNETDKAAKTTLSDDKGVISSRHLFRLLQTPLFLFYLINIVDETQEIPGSDQEIIETFIDRLLNRERGDKNQTQINKKHIWLLLSLLGYESFEKYKTNTGMPELWVETQLQTLIERYRIPFSTYDFLTLMTELNILRLDQEQYTFSHQSFQDVLYGKGLIRFFAEMEAKES